MKSGRIISNCSPTRWTGKIAVRASRYLSRSLLLTLSLGWGPAGAADGAHREAIRNFLIVKHCGFETYEIRAGFRIEVMNLIGNGDISPSTARMDRDTAAEEVRREWRNRGMGRADPRCLTIGRAAVAHFLAVLTFEN